MRSRTARLLKVPAFHALRASGAMPIVRRFFAGRGAIVMFHEIHNTDDERELRTGTSTAMLDHILRWLRRSGWEIVSLDECVRRINSDQRFGRFAALTFDDGYRDTLTRALPILERHQAPFTTYVPTHALTRTLRAWWLGLRELFRQQDIVDLEPMGKRIVCASMSAKAQGLQDVVEWVHEDYRRISTLAPLFERAAISFPALNEAYFLNDDELRRLARHPLAGIGGHTTSHPAVALLTDQAVYREMTENRQHLEQVLQQEVSHFSFPYGTARACGARDFAIAAKAGFSTAVTTVQAPITESTRKHHSLPRIGVSARDTLASFDAKISGLQHWFTSALGQRRAVEQIASWPRGLRNSTGSVHPAE